MRVVWLSLIALAGLAFGMILGPPWPVTLVGLPLLLLLIAGGIRRVPEGHVAVIERLNRFARVSGPGLVWVTPVLERIARFVYVRLRAERFGAEEIRSEEKVPLDFSVMISYGIDFSVADRLRRDVAYYTGDKWHELVESYLESALTNEVRAYPVFSIIGSEQHSWNDIQDKVRRHLTETLSQWAIVLDANQGVVLRNVRLPLKLREALEKAVATGVESKTSIAVLEMIHCTYPGIPQPILLELMQALHGRDASQMMIFSSGVERSLSDKDVSQVESGREIPRLSDNDDLKRGTLIIQDIEPRSEESTDQDE